MNNNTNKQKEHITVSVDSVVFGYTNQSLNVLLIKREKDPFKGKWAIPGGLLSAGLTAKEEASTVLKTKAGISIEFLEQLFTFDAINRDPRSRTISLAFFALVNSDHYKISIDNKSHDAQWFQLTKLPELAFDHKEIIKTAIARLQGKILYQPIGFELLSEEFTLSELQHLYEVVLNTGLDKRNFRKKIISSDIVSATGKKRLGARNRQPELYRFNEKEYNRLLKQGFNFKIV
jgi:8-oxo-dGTP diphosphatase